MSSSIHDDNVVKSAIFLKTLRVYSADKDECAEGVTCEDGKYCSNTPGSYECVGM